MQMPRPSTIDEEKRVDALRSFRVLDTAPEARFDRITELASSLCHVPMAVITLVDTNRVWLKSNHGIPGDEIERESSFCSRAIDSPGMLIVPNALGHPHYQKNPWVAAAPGVRFYAGAPLRTKEGFALGCLAVMDTQPRNLAPDQQRALTMLAAQVVELMEASSGNPLADAVEELADCLFSIQSDWKITYVNRRAELFFGKPRSELLGNPIWQILPDLAGSPFSKQLSKALESRSRSQFEDFLPAQNGWFEVRTYPQKTGITVSLSNITHRKYAEEMLKRSEARFSGIFRSGLIGIVFGDSNGNIEDANDAFLHLLGYTREDLANGKVRWDRLNPPDAIEASRKVMEQVRRSGSCAPFEKEYLRKDGTRVSALVSVTILREMRNSTVTLVLDLTEKKNAERLIEEQRLKMISASKMSLLGEMASGVGHFINNPLVVISGQTQRIRDVARKNGYTDEKLEQSALRIDQTVERISKIIRSLRSFARESEDEPFTSVELRSLVDDALDLCRARLEEHGVALHSPSIPEDARLECQPRHLQQVILSIVSNSHDAVIDLEEKWIRMEVENQEGHWRISITDSGTGIPTEVAHKIFQPFFSTKEVGRGSGLGLSTAKGILESHSGSIELDHSSAHTRFVIVLPKSQPRKKARAA